MMTSTGFAFAVLGLLQTRCVQSAIYPDVADGTCIVGQSCTAGIMEPIRGLCVEGGECWDACNTAHAPDTYSQVEAEKAGIALMVKQFRTGMRGADSCDGSALTPTCNAGERCTPTGSTWGRGMCITVVVPIAKGNQCLDMCDTNIPLTEFHDTPGKQAGTVTIVEQIRAGRDPAGLTTCPGPSTWLWLWIPLLLCAIVGCCGLGYYMFNFYKGKLRRNKDKSYREPEQQFDEQGPYVDYNQDMPQQDGPRKKGIPMMAGQEVQSSFQVEPMPVIQQQAPLYEAPMSGNIFGAMPNLMAGSTVAAPASMYTGMAAPMAATTYSTPVTMGGYPSSVYPQAMAQPQYASSMQVAGGGLTTQMPQYSAYGAYGGGAYGTTTTGSMRIG